MREPTSTSVQQLVNANSSYPRTSPFISPALLALLLERKGRTPGPTWWRKLATDSTFATRAYLQAFWHSGSPGGGSCASLERLGSSSDGGKFVCDVDSLFGQPEGCHVVSVGSNGDTSFESAVHAKAPACVIDTYDGSFVGARAPLADRIPSYVRFFAQHFREGSVKRYVGERAVDLLKMDCEGCEERVLSFWLKLAPPRQIVLELHGCKLRGRFPFAHHNESASDAAPRLDRMHHMMQMVYDAGFRVFAVEPNLEWSDGTCIEYSFKRL